MADEVSPQYPSAVPQQQASSGWAVGFILFAAMVMIMVGVRWLRERGRDGWQAPRRGPCLPL